MERHTSTVRRLLPSAVFRLVPACFAAALWVVLAACGGGSSSSSTAASTPPPSPLMIKSASGTDRPADGTWYECHFDSGGGTDVGTEYVFSGPSFSYYAMAFTSTSGLCTAPTTNIPVTLFIAATAALNAPVAAYWSDNTNSGATFTPLPPKASGGSLPIQPTASSLTLTVTSSMGSGAPPVGASAKQVGFIDDTGTQQKWWRSTNNPAACTNAAGDQLCLSVNDPLGKF